MKGILYQRRLLVGVLLVLLLTSSVSIVSNDNLSSKKRWNATADATDGSIITMLLASTEGVITVDDEGDGDFTTIQEAIDEASDGDTIEIYSGTYYENVNINHRLTLKGIPYELDTGTDEGMPVVNGGGNHRVITLFKSGTIITGLHVVNATDGIIFYNSPNNNTISGNIIQARTYGIELWYTNNNTVTNNSISASSYGIAQYFSSNNTIFDNTVVYTTICLLLHTSTNNTVFNNSFSNSQFGIQLWSLSNRNVIYKNSILKNNVNAIHLEESSNNVVFGNSIVTNNKGIFISNNSNDNIVYHNILQNHTINAVDACSNQWDDGKEGNYWDNYELRYPNATTLNGIWDTAYEIPTKNKDRYPLTTTDISTTDSLPPRIIVSSPNGGEVINGTISISWTSIDDTAMSPNQPVTIKYSSDGGATWHIIVSEVLNTGFYNWDTTSVQDSNRYLIRIETTNSASKTGRDTSDSMFEIRNHEFPLLLIGIVIIILAIVLVSVILLFRQKK